MKEMTLRGVSETDTKVNTDYLVYHMKMITHTTLLLFLTILLLNGCDSRKPIPQEEELQTNKTEKLSETALNQLGNNYTEDQSVTSDISEPSNTPDPINMRPVEDTINCVSGYEFINSKGSMSFYSDGTFMSSIEMFGGLIRSGDWYVNRSGYIEVSTTYTSTGDYIPDQSLTLLRCNEIQVGQTTYLKY